jgi:hypothetical protein
VLVERGKRAVADSLMEWVVREKVHWRFDERNSSYYFTRSKNVSLGFPPRAKDLMRGTTLSHRWDELARSVRVNTSGSIDPLEWCSTRYNPHSTERCTWECLWKNFKATPDVVTYLALIESKELGVFKAEMRGRNVRILSRLADKTLAWGRDQGVTTFEELVRAIDKVARLLAGCIWMLMRLSRHVEIIRVGEDAGKILFV